MRSRRVWIVLTLLAMATPAHANAAMPYAYQIFYPGPWWVYVVVTVLFEAWVMGRILKRPIRRALLTSVIANTVSSMFLFVATGPFHSAALDLDPFAWSLNMLTICAVVSAVIEGGIWAVQSRKETVSVPRAILGSFLVHAVGVPLGLLILLAPAYPYPGIDAAAHNARIRCFDRSMNRLKSDGQASLIGVTIKSLEDLEAKYPCHEGGEAALFHPHYARWDRREMKRLRSTAEWHTGISFFQTVQGSKETDWIWRQRFDDGFTQGWIIDRSTDGIERTLDPTKLGFSAR